MRAYLSGWAVGLMALGAAFTACGGEEFASTGTGGGTTGGAAGSGGATSGGGTTAGGSGGSVAGAGGSVAGAGGSVAGAGGSSAGAGGTGTGATGGADGGCTDLDNDGQTTCAGDCDDNDPSVQLGGKEICGDGKDNDCKGGADDGCNGMGAFVSEKIGLDSNPGTKTAPLKTIMKGIANADAIRKALGTPNAKTEVFIAQGTYATEKVKLLEGVGLIGGHQCESSSNCTWLQNPALYESIITAIDFEGTLADPSISRATRVESLTLRGKNGSPPGGSFGSAALMLDGGRPSVKGCKIVAPDATGSWPQGRSAGIFIAYSADTVGALITGNTISGGSSSWAHGILMANRPSQSKVGQAEIRSNTISGGTGTESSAAVSLENSGPGTLVWDNDISAGTSQKAWGYGVGIGATAAVDSNRINLPGTTAKCNGTGWCGGIDCESCSGSITNNVVFGADAPSSTALHMVEAEKPAGNIVVHSNYLNGSGSNSGGAKSVGISLEIGSCTTCGFKGKTGRIRDNIIEVGVAATRCGVMETAPSGKQMHPEAFEFNWFSNVNAMASPCLYSAYDGAAAKVWGTAAAVNTNLPSYTTAASNLDGDPMVDVANKYHLKKGSPCIDKGTNNEAPPKDMDGQNRPMGNNFDIGPDESQ